jgi:hypothetical protein
MREKAVPELADAAPPDKPKPDVYVIKPDVLDGVAVS